MNNKKWFQSILFTLFCFILAIGLILCAVWLVSFFSKPICTYMLILSVSGGFGGLCYALLESKGRVKLCTLIVENEKDRKLVIDLGNIADIMIGIGAAFAVFLVLSGLVALTNDIKAVQPSTIFVLASLGVVSGAGGKVVFPILVDKLEKMIQTQKIAAQADENASVATKKALDAVESTKILQANLYLQAMSFDEAEAKYQEVLNTNPMSVKAIIGLSVVKGSKKEYDEAVELCNKALAIEPDNAYAYYNRACNNHLLGLPFSQIKNDLKKAIDLDKSFREYAIGDPDFTDIKEIAEFKEITNPPNR